MRDCFERMLACEEVNGASPWLRAPALRAKPSLMLVAQTRKVRRSPPTPVLEIAASRMSRRVDFRSCILHVNRTVLLAGCRSLQHGEARTPLVGLAKNSLRAVGPLLVRHRMYCNSGPACRY